MADPVKEFELYRQELLEGLGDRDPLDVLAGTPEAVRNRLSEVDDELAARRPGSRKWSVREVIGHLADTEWVYGYRLRLMLTHDSPAIAGYDQDLMAAGLRHNERPLAELVSEWGALRELNVGLYRRTQGESWERVGLHSERGPESVGLSVRLLAGHDLRHLRQIDRTLEQVSGPE